MSKCKHQDHQTDVLPNGGMYCKACGQTNLMNKIVRDESGHIVFKGNIWDCEKWMDENKEKS